MFNIEYQDLTESEKRVYVYLANNGAKIQDMRIQDLAKETLTSKTVIINLVKKMGFEGYANYKYYLKSNSTKTEQDVSRNTEALIRNSIDRTLSLLDDKKTLLVAKKIANAEIVYIIARGTSKAVGYYLQHLLLVNNIACIFLDDYNLSGSVTKKMHRSDVVITISLSGSTKKIVECANNVKLSNGYLVSISSFSYSPLAEISDVALYSVCDNPSTEHNDDLSRMGMFAIVEILVDRLKRLQ